MSDIPTIEDSGIWGPQPLPPICPEPTFDEALLVVLTAGDILRKCDLCQSPATAITCEQYTYVPEEQGIFAQLHETCADCDNEFGYLVPMGWWAAMQAMNVWEQGRTAMAAIQAELDNRADLDALDGTARKRAIDRKRPDIPVALMFCTICNKWLESRDGKAPCICPVPDIIEGMHDGP